jgi:hypothetical protein
MICFGFNVERVSQVFLIALCIKGREICGELYRVKLRHSTFANAKNYEMRAFCFLCRLGMMT